MKKSKIGDFLFSMGFKEDYPSGFYNIMNDIHLDVSKDTYDSSDKSGMIQSLLIDMYNSGFSHGLDEIKIAVKNTK